MLSLKKILSRFNKDERKVLELLIDKIISLDWRNLDIKKLKKYQNFFRLRKGNIRIIFNKNKNKIAIITIERRREDTYKL